MPWLLILVYFLNMPCCWHTWKCQPIACRVSIPIWSHKTQKWEFKKRAPITWFTKFNYLEKRWFVVRLGWPSHKLNANEYARWIMDSLVPHRLSAQYGSHAITRVRSSYGDFLNSFAMKARARPYGSYDDFTFWAFKIDFGLLKRDNFYVQYPRIPF